MGTAVKPLSADDDFHCASLPVRRILATVHGETYSLVFSPGPCIRRGRLAALKAGTFIAPLPLAKKFRSCGNPAPVISRRQSFNLGEPGVEAWTLFTDEV